MKQITVVIPNYNGKKYLNSCLRALYANTDMEIDVVVVDNRSTDGSIEDAKKSYPKVNYILLDKNYGFSRAVNEGIKAARTPYVLLLNNDTEIKKGFVEALLAAIKRSRTIFSVEAKMLQYKDPQKIDSAGTFYNALGWAFARGKDSCAFKYEFGCETFAACGGAALYRKSVFEEIGFFDEDFFAYLEDVDIGYRAKIYGYRNMYEPKAQVLHVGSASSGSRYNEFKVRFSAKNNLYLIHKNMPWVQIILNMPFLIIGFGTKTLFFLKKGMLKAYVQGLREGMKLCGQKPKMVCMKGRWVCYMKIQTELWLNIARKRW